MPVSSSFLYGVRGWWLIFEGLDAKMVSLSLFEFREMSCSF